MAALVSEISPAVIDRARGKHYKQLGVNDPLMTRDERRRTMVSSGNACKKERIDERVSWRMNNICVVPLWRCYIYTPEDLHEG